MTFGELTCMIFGGLSPKFTQLAGSKKKAFAAATLICLLTSVAFYFIPMSPAYIWLMVGIVVLTSVGIGIYSPLLWSMYADVADYATQQNGTSSTGLIFSSGTLSPKFGSALSGAPVAVKQMIWMLFSLFPAVIAGLMLLMVKLYPINK